MQTSQIEEYREKYREAQIKIDSYLIRRMNLIANQTVVRLGDYNLVGALALLSFSDAQLIAVLSPNEMNHFKRFAGKPSSLVLAFDRPGVKEPVRYHLRTSLSAIAELPGRPNICLVQLQLKLIPPEFMVIMCDIFDDLAARREAFGTYCAEEMAIDPKDFQVAAIKPRGELSGGGKRIMVDVRGVSSCKARVELPEWPFAGELPAKLSLKLVGVFGTFPVSCSFDGDPPSGPGACLLNLEFSNELISNLEEWRTRLAIRARAARQAAAQGLPGQPSTST